MVNTITASKKSKIIDKLSKTAKVKLDLLPDWIAFKYPRYSEKGFEIVEGGAIALTVILAKEIVIKIFVPKYHWVKDYEHSKKLVQNYIDLKKSHFDLSEFGIISFTQNDEILQAPVLVSKFYQNSKPLVEVYHKLSTNQKLKIAGKIVQLTKRFNRKVEDYTYSSKRILDEFDQQFNKHQSTVPENMLRVFSELRQKVKPRKISKNIFLVHGDIHLENILVDNKNNLHFIDFDFCHFAPLFTELEVIFMLCFMPAAVVPETLEPFYNKPLLEIWNTFKSDYPELWNDSYLDEIKLLYATQLIPKAGDKKFSKTINDIFNRFFVEKSLL